MINSGKLPHIIVFFSYGNSLLTWADAGILSRELLIYKKMVKNGIRVSFLTYGDEKDFGCHQDLGGINIIPVYIYMKKHNNRWLNLIKSFLIPFIPEMRKIFKSADIYKTNQMVGAWVPLITKLLFKKPLIVRCGYEMLRNLLRDEKNLIKWMITAALGYILEFWAYLESDKIIISNKSDRNFIFKWFPVKRNKLNLIRNFIDTEIFNHKTSLVRANKKGKKILYVGRIEHRKNLKNLILGVTETDASLDLIGRGSSQEYYEQLAEGKNIHFVGVVDNNELPEIINQYDLFVLPSFYENNPKTLLEAMACGQLVLGTNVEGIKELIQDGKTGFLCGTDPTSIQTAIQKVFSLSDEAVTRISLKARQYIIQECAIKTVFVKEVNMYTELVS